MLTYWTLKYVHIIGAAVLLGTGAGIAFFMLLGHRTGKPAIIAAIARIVVIADFLFTATAVVAQPVSNAAATPSAASSIRNDMRYLLQRLPRSIVRDCCFCIHTVGVCGDVLVTTTNDRVAHE